MPGRSPIMALVRPGLDRVQHMAEPFGHEQRRVAVALGALDDEWTIDLRPRLTMDVPDLLAVHPEHGVVAIEVLDWTADDHRADGRGGVERREDDGWVPELDRPLFRAARHRAVVFEQFVALPEDESSEMVRAAVVVPAVSTITARELLPDCPDHVTVWGGDVLGHPLTLLAAHRTHPLPARGLARLDEHLAPSEAELQRAPRTRLSAAAADIAHNPERRLLRGVWGVPGSGLTYGLAARAAHIAGTGRSVLVLTGTPASTSTVRALATRRCREIASNPAQIVCMSLHGFCRRVAEDATNAGLRLHLPEGTPLHDMNIGRAHAAYRRGFGPRFDAVLVDEGQHVTLESWNMLRAHVRSPGGEMLLAVAAVPGAREDWSDPDVRAEAGLDAPWSELTASYGVPADLLPIAQALGERHLPGLHPLPILPFDADEVVGASAPTRLRWISASDDAATPRDGLGGQLARATMALLDADPTLSPDEVVILCNRHDQGLVAVTLLRGAGFEVHHAFAHDPDERRRRSQRFWVGGSGISATTIEGMAGAGARAVVLGVAAGEDAAAATYLGLTRVRRAPDGLASALTVVSADPRLADVPARAVPSGVAAALPPPAAPPTHLQPAVTTSVARVSQRTLL